MVRQVHGADVAVVDRPWSYDDRPEADAIVSATPGTALGIVTADCAPVLFCDAAAGIIGAAHAGWRGALAGVCEATVAAMEQLGARRSHIAAAVGPAIAQGSYEVDRTLRAAFADGDDAFFAAAGQEGRYRFDLPGYIARRLDRAGIADVEVSPVDTYTEEAGFFSYRRATHAGNASEGRQIAIIAKP